MESLRKAAPGSKIGNADDVVRKVIMRKTACELDCLREAARISELGFRAVLEGIRAGMTEAQLSGLAVAAMMANGAESPRYPVWCCSGPNSRRAISRPTHRQFNIGEIIHFSVGAKVAGYSASIGRPIAGTLSRTDKNISSGRPRCMRMTIDLMRAGTVSGEVARTVPGWIRDQGFGRTILYSPAHGCQEPFDFHR